MTAGVAGAGTGRADLSIDDHQRLRCREHGKAACSTRREGPTVFTDAIDRLDPRADLPSAARSRLRALAAGAAAILWNDLLANLGFDEDAAWRADADRDEKGWTAAELERFVLWKFMGGNVETARAEWTRVTRCEFVRHLIADGRMGVGDEVTSRG